LTAIKRMNFILPLVVASGAVAILVATQLAMKRQQILASAFKPAYALAGRLRAYSNQERRTSHMSFLSEFKTFAVRGNVIDMAVGIIIGAAFGKIVSSFVDGVVMPPLGLLIGGVDFSDLAIVLKEAVGDAPAVTLNYGMFIQTVVDFVIIAFAIFLAIKAINTLKRQEAEAPSAPPAPTKEEVLLTEIRDLLKEQNRS